MLTKIVIPVLDTEKGKYEFEGKLTREAYGEMVMNKFLSTNTQMNRFVDNIAHGISNVAQNRFYNVDRTDYPEELYEFYETEAFIQDSKKNDIESEYFTPYIESEKMFILLININPNTLEGDAESELRFWIDDSRRVHDDKTLDDKTKLKALPKRWLKIYINEKQYILEGCKILQDFSNKKWPFYIGVIVEKITE